MEQLHINGINEELVSILTEATKKQITPASILIEILKSKNAISDYMTVNSNILDLTYDLEKEHQRLLDNHEKIQEHTVSYVNNLETADRYTTVLRFIDDSLDHSLFAPIYKNTIGKYIKIDYFKEDVRNMLLPKPNQSWKAVEETILDAFGRDLTKLSMDGELSKVIGREDEVQRMVQILTRQTKSNPVLLGKAGVGKTALVEKLAEVINAKEVPHSLIGWKVIELNVAKLLSQKQIEEILMEIIEVAHREQAILFIDEVHLINNDKGKIANLLKPAMARGQLKLIGATTHDEYRVFEKDEAILRRFQPINVDEPTLEQVYEILKSKAEEAEKFHNVLIPKETLLKAISLSDRYVQDRQQPDKAIDLVEESASRLRGTLESRPQVIVELERKISENAISAEIIRVNAGENISQRDSKKIEKLETKSLKLTQELNELEVVFKEQHGVLTSVIESKEALIALKRDRDKALHLGDFEVAVDYDANDIPETEKAIADYETKLIDMAATVDENLIQNVVVPSMVERVIETITGIPVGSQNEDDMEKYRDMEEALSKEVHGQDKPIELIAKAIKRSKAGLSDADKPLGSFLCLGPTGVGKTYLARKLTEFMFDTDKVLKRFDMSEYMEGHSVSRMFGSPPGYVGHDEGGQLTEVIRRNPYSVILFDEIEKAHPKVFNALLQILDAGRMTDGKGNEINFKNTVIVMTSNIGSDIIHQGLEKGTPSEAIEMALFNELDNHFRPEFLNRFDSKLMFNALSFEDIIKITDSELQKLAERLNENNELTMYWHPLVAESIADQAYDIMNGARPIKRFIDDVIISMLTNKIMDGEITPGDQIYLASSGTDFDVFTVDNEMLEVLKETETGHKKKKKKKKKGIILTPSGEEIDLGASEDSDLPTELGD